MCAGVCLLHKVTFHARRWQSARAFACVSLCEDVIACMCPRVCLSLPFDCLLNLWHVQQSYETADRQSGGWGYQKKKGKVDVCTGGETESKEVKEQEKRTSEEKDDKE